MFAFSLSKILFTVFIVAVVWYGFQWFSRVQSRRERQARLHESRRKRAKKAPPADVEDLVQCPVCKAYVPAVGAKNCGEPDCPYPG